VRWRSDGKHGLSGRIKQRFILAPIMQSVSHNRRTQPTRDHRKRCIFTHADMQSYHQRSFNSVASTTYACTLHVRERGYRGFKSVFEVQGARGTRPPFFCSSPLRFREKWVEFSMVLAHLLFFILSITK